MPMRVFGLISKISSKFFDEAVPVALASVIGVMLVNHYGRQPASPAVVVQAPASEDALLQSLREEHELIVDYMKRRREAEAERALAGAAAPLINNNLPAKPRSGSADKVASRPSPRPAPEKRLAAGDPLPLTPDLSSVPGPPPPQPSPPIGPGARAVRFAGAVRDFVVDVAQIPARTLVSHALDDRPTPPLAVPVSAPDPARRD
jgi:hypothetical protein